MSSEQLNLKKFKFTIKKNKECLNLNDINSRIEKEYSGDVTIQISDEKLIDKYKECQSVKNSVDELTTILKKHSVEDSKLGNILEDYLPKLIPPGTKGVIRGNKFNQIIKEKIENMDLDKEIYSICFESKCPIFDTDEIPDWYILEKSTNKIIIGMNQLDLWSGGQQINRGSKYIINNQNNSEKRKLLCVVCNKILLKSSKNKTFNLFKVGFEKNTLCYLNNLQNIIYSYFNLK